MFFHELSESHGSRTVQSEWECACGARRHPTKAGLAAAAGGGLNAGAPAKALPQARVGVAMRTGTARRIDIHTHFFPESCLNLLNEEGKRYSSDYTRHGDTFDFHSPAGNNVNLSWVLVDLNRRLADMARQGVDVQLISLTNPTASWGDEAFASKLARTWNDEASKICAQKPEAAGVPGGAALLAHGRSHDGNAQVKPSLRTGGDSRQRVGGWHRTGAQCR